MMMETSPGGLVAYQSDRAEELVDRLVYELVQERKRRAGSPADWPFVEHMVVIPTRNLETYLSFEIAARIGVSAGIEYVTMERFLEGLLPVDEAGELKVRLLDEVALTRLVLALLDDDVLAKRPALKAVQEFVVPYEGASAKVVERRKYQLANRMAHLFETYGYGRQNVLKHWRNGDSALEHEYKQDASAAHFAIEEWQMALWREIFGPDGLARNCDDDHDERPWLTLPEAIYHHLREDEGELAWPKMVHFFGHSYLPRFYKEVFATRTMAEDAAIALYVLNPALEHWSHGIAGDRDEDPVFDLLTIDSILEGDEYPLPLAVWGRAGRDYQRMIDEVAYDRVDVSQRHDRPDYTLLQRFQEMIREMKTSRDIFVDTEVPADEKSLNFWSCASAQRECEAIASEIWELVTVHDDLRFNDIAVVVQPGQRTIYQTHLEAAFEQTGGIPCNVIDVEGSEKSPFLEASSLLLALPLGKFTRRELLALLVHPNLVANYPDADKEAWLQWCEAVNIFQGGRREDLDDTYLRQDRFTWGQGLRRLVLGAFMSQPESGRPQALKLGDELYLPHETNHEDLDTMAMLTMVADELISEARRCRTQKLTLADWMEYFADQVSGYLAPQDRREERVRMTYLGCLGRIAESDACPKELVGYRTAYDFAMAGMSELEETRGQYLADGVVVSAFRPMRPIPFQVVFITGLGEGCFPAPDPPDMLDLRRVKSEEHDVNPRYQDQYMFLETLISTRSRLYLSWVGRHGITGEELEPASVVHQFREMILEMAPSDGGEAEEIRSYLEERVDFEEHPLRRYDGRYFPEFSEGDDEPEIIDARGPDAIAPAPESERESGDLRPERIWPNHHREARQEARVQAIRHELQKKLPAGYRPTMQELAQSLEVGAFAQLADVVRWSKPAAERVDGDSDRVILQIRHLRNFLQCPLQGSAQVVLHLYSEDEKDVLDAEHEPFQAGFLTRLMLVRRSFEEALARGDLSDSGLEGIFDEYARAAELAGDLPAGVFFEAEREKSLQRLRNYASAFGDDFEGKLKRIRFGTAREREEVDEVYDPLTLQISTGGRPVTVELHGVIKILDDNYSSLVPAAGKKAKAKHIVDGGIEQIVLQAAGIDTRGETTVVTADGKLKKRGISGRSAEEAQRYLSELSEDLLGRVHDYFLPVEFVEDLVKGEVDDYEMSARNKKEPGYGRDHADVSSVYGPVRRWQTAPPPSWEAAEEIIAVRYGPFVDVLRGDKK